MKMRGYTLVELIVAVGLFAIVMTLVSGAYIVMINLTQRTQGSATGIYNLSFALETMTRTIRTGTNYFGSESTFSVTNSNWEPMVYSLSSGAIAQNGVALTDPSVNVTSLNFNVSGATAGDNLQPYVTIIVSGTVSSERGSSESFTVETGATMRTPDI